MAVTEDVIRLVLETKGQGSIEDLQQNLEYTRATLGQLKSAYERGEVSTDQYLKTGARLTRQEQELVDVLVAVEQAERAATIATKQATVEAERATIAAGKQSVAQDKVADSTAKATNKVAGFGQAGLQAGRVVQDFTQGGIAGILNNIEGLSMALGGGAGLAGVLTILGTAFFVLKPVIAEFVKSMSPEPVKDFQTTIEALQARIKEISEKPVKLHVEVKELENAKEQIDAITKGLAALELAKSGRTPDEKAAGDKFTKEFDETGGEGKAAIEAVERQMGDDVIAADPKARAARKAIADRERALKATQQAQKEAQERAVQARGLGDPDFLAQAQAEADSFAKEAEALADPAVFEKLRDNLRKAVDDAKEMVGKEIGNTLADVKKGNNPVARDVMAERFRAAGQDRFAAMVEQSSPEALRESRQEHVVNALKGFLDKAQAALLDKTRQAIEKKRKADDIQSAALIAQFEAPALGDKALADQKKKNKPDDKLLAKQVKDATDATDAREKTLKETSLDEDAAEYAARLQAQGGAVDKNGQFRKMTRDQQEEQVRREVGKRIQGANPGLDPMSQSALTNRFTQGAYKQVDDTTEQARMAIAQQAKDSESNLTGRQITNAAMQEALAAITAIANKQRQEEAKTQQLGQGFAQVRRFMQRPGGPPNFPGGR